MLIIVQLIFLRLNPIHIIIQSCLLHIAQFLALGLLLEQTDLRGVAFL